MKDEGGTLDICDGDEITPINIWHTSYRFNAHTTYHRTGDFSGDRFTITFYSVRDFNLFSCFCNSPY